MTRRTIVFGNGLGMAVDPVYFSLENALGEVWERDGVLDDNQRRLIQQCLPERGEVQHPTGEHELDTIQVALTACDALANIQGGDIHWLSDVGQRFPLAVRKYIYEVSLSFRANPFLQLSDNFINPLGEFIRNTNSTVATLNYDNLLYQPLVDRGILRGYNGNLVDGFYRAGFSEDNLERRYGREFGYYLHLHGSPLFIDQDGVTVKVSQRELGEEDLVGSHIVLTHVAHKQRVIAASDVLMAYWRRLFMALNESEGLLLFGYSGLDDHLNNIISAAYYEEVIRIVEWTGSGEKALRQEFWEDRFNKEIDLVHLDSILNYVDWD